jgi:hypothetical protein
MWPTGHEDVAKREEARMKFWKYEYESVDALEACIRHGALPSADKNFPGLTNTHSYPTGAMKVGDGVVLGKLEGDAAKIFAVGLVRRVQGNGLSAIVDWTATTKTVFPNAKGGLANWQQKSAFEISPELAKRYGLKELIQYYVRSDDK